MILKGTKIWSRFWGPGVVDALKDKPDGKYGHCIFEQVICWMPVQYLVRLEDAPKAVAQEEKKQTRKLEKRAPSGADWISTEEASARLGTKTRLEVTIMCKKGQLEARKEGRNWLVSVKGLELYMAR